MDERFDVVVVGAGLAGLTAAATAARGGASTLVLDGHQPGGRASTDERGRYRFNRGPHALYQGGEATAVLARLGVSVTGAFPPGKGARGRLGERVDVLPADLPTMLRSRLVSLRGKVALARFLAGVKKWRPSDVAGLTIGQWLDGFHLPEDARRLALFLVRTATYLNDEQHVSADVAAGQIQMALANNVHYLDGGWASLVDGLAQAARRHGVEIRPGAAVQSIGASAPSGGGVTVVAAGGQQISAGAVVLAAGTPDAAATLLGEQPSAWTGLGPEVEASCLDLGLRQRLAHPVLFGIDPPIYLVDHAWSAEGLAPDGGGLVQVLHYLPLGDDTPPGALRAGLEEHARLAGVDPALVEEQRFLLRMTVVGATPTPASGGLAGRPPGDSPRGGGGVGAGAGGGRGPAGAPEPGPAAGPAAGSEGRWAPDRSAADRSAATRFPVPETRPGRRWPSSSRPTGPTSRRSC